MIGEEAECGCRAENWGLEESSCGKMNLLDHHHHQYAMCFSGIRTAFSGH